MSGKSGRISARSLTRTTRHCLVMPASRRSRQNAGGFATGQPLDVAPGGSVLFAQAEYAAGADDRFTGSSDDELAGIICGLDRAEAAASCLKHAAVAELIRRRPAPGCRPQGPAQMPEA
jgi:hypothetical protein